MKLTNKLQLFKIDWDCAEGVFTKNLTIIKAIGEITKEQARQAIEQMGTGSVYINDIKKVQEIDIRNFRCDFYLVKNE